MNSNGPKTTWMLHHNRATWLLGYVSKFVFASDILVAYPVDFYSICRYGHARVNRYFHVLGVLRFGTTSEPEGSLPGIMYFSPSGEIKKADTVFVLHSSPSRH